MLPYRFLIFLTLRTTTLDVFSSAMCFFSRSYSTVYFGGSCLLNLLGSSKLTFFLLRCTNALLAIALLAKAGCTGCSFFNLYARTGCLAAGAVIYSKDLFCLAPTFRNWDASLTSEAN